MAPVVRSSLPTVKTTRLYIDPEQPICTHDFLRGLKRPTRKNQLVSGAPGTIRFDFDSPVVLESQVAETGSSRKLGPPVTCPDQILDGRKQGDDCIELKGTFKVTQSYTKEKVTALPVNISRSSSPLFRPQRYASDEQSGEQTPKAKRYKQKSRSADAPTCSEEVPRRNPAMSWVDNDTKGHQSGGALASKSKNQDKHKKRETTKEKRKKRRAPVNELALVFTLPASPDSLYANKVRSKASEMDTLRSSYGLMLWDRASHSIRLSIVDPVKKSLVRLLLIPKLLMSLWTTIPSVGPSRPRNVIFGKQ